MFATVQTGPTQRAILMTVVRLARLPLPLHAVRTGLHRRPDNSAPDRRHGSNRGFMASPMRSQDHDGVADPSSLPRVQPVLHDFLSAERDDLIARCRSKVLK